jgi:hypothetical protein
VRLRHGNTHILLQIPIQYTIYVCCNIYIDVRPLPFFCNAAFFKKILQILFLVGKQIMTSISRAVGFNVLGQSSYVHSPNPASALIWPTPSVIGGTDGMSLFLFGTAN